MLERADRSLKVKGKAGLVNFSGKLKGKKKKRWGESRREDSSFEGARKAKIG